MLSFKQFLAEQWNDYTDTKGTHRVTRASKIGPHDVHVFFKNGVGGDKKHYSVDFSVDYKFHAGAKERSPMENPHVVHAIGHHVHSSVSEFIAKHKPNKISVSGSSDKKDKVYGVYTKRFAAKRGAKVTTKTDEFDSKTHTMHFGEANMPKDREVGTDTLVLIYKKATPGQ